VREKNIVRLKEGERNQFKEIITKGKTVVFIIKRASIMLKTDTDGPTWPE